jgi:hypothetical protein
VALPEMSPYAAPQKPTSTENGTNVGADLGQFDGKDLDWHFRRIWATEADSLSWMLHMEDFPESARPAPSTTVGDAEAGDGERERGRSGGNGGGRRRRMGATEPRQLGGGAVKP